MLPQINPNKARPKTRPRPLPASSNPLLPNGTYSSSVVTAPFGAQGQYGAMLPQVNVNGSGLTPQQFNAVPFANNLTARPPTQPAPFLTSQQAFSAGLMSNKQTAPYFQLAANQPYKQPQPGGSPFLTGQNLANSPIAQGFGTGLNQQANMEAVMMRIAQGQDPSTLSAAEQAALESAINSQKPIDPAKPYGGYTNTGGGQYADTASAQYYAASGTPFGEQQTYINGKPMKIKDAIRKGLLDVKTGKRFNVKRNKKGRPVPVSGGGGGETALAATQSQPIPSFGVVNMQLNTATG